MSFIKFTRPVQIKLWQFCHHFADDFSRPVNKFTQQMIFGILKSGSVQLNSIGRALQEKISLKKVVQRLSNHLAKAGLWQQISTATLKTQVALLKKCRFVIVDPTDAVSPTSRNGTRGKCRGKLVSTTAAKAKPPLGSGCAM